MHHSFSDDYEELPYPQEYDYLWTKERYAKFEESGARVLSLWPEDRQGVTRLNPLLVAIVVGLTYSALLLLAPLVRPLEERPKLPDDPMCGIPTGEQFLFGSSTENETASQLLQNSENPAAKTKLSCFLPWVALQYGLSYKPDNDKSQEISQSPISTGDAASSSDRPTSSEGSALSTLSAFAGLSAVGQVQQIISLLLDDSETFSGIGTAALALGGGAVTRATCSPPFCTARTGQCCLLGLDRRGRLVCPRSC